MLVRSIVTAVLLSSFGLGASATESPIGSSCAFLANAPVLDVDIPSVLHKLQFFGVDAKVYRQTLASGSKPKLRFVRYSSAPTVDVKDGRILISTEGNQCSHDTPSAKEATSSSPGLVFTGLLKTLAMSTVAAGLGASNQAGPSVLLGVLLAVLHSFPKRAAAAPSPGCTPAMEIVLEAPPYYLGSVEECLRSVSNPDHCPEPFPQFPQCTDVAPACQLAVVGAGTGGLYTAYRLLEEGVFDGSDVCVFEATDRVGGRLYSLRGFGPEGDITVDAGGYRTWPEYGPTTHALITEMLGFEVACYNGDDPCSQYNIVGEDGEKIGFASFVEELMSRLVAKGACFFPRHNLVSIQHHEEDGSNTLAFSNGVTSTASHSTILNIPQRALLEVMRASDLYSSSDPQQAKDGANEEKATYDALHSVQTEIVTKLYLYYEDAWWHRLGIKDGDFALLGDARNMLLQGRYHDGHVKCKLHEDGEERCHGFLLAVYAHDFSGTKAQYFRRFQRDRPEPVTILSATNPEEEDFLKHAHKRIVDYHVYEDSEAALNATSYTQYQLRKVMEATVPPTFAVLANWNTAVFGAGGGWHHWTDMSNSEKAMKPLNSFGLHVVNEAFSKVQGWAEGSLLLADEILEEYFEVARPWDFEVPDGVFYLAQTSSEECVAEEDSGGGGSTSGGGGGGGGPGGGALDPCFVAGSMVELGDGSLVPIEHVQAGDSVATGVDGKIGLVTKKLVHPVQGTDNKSNVVVTQTEHGDLVGTPNHPMLFLVPNVNLRDQGSNAKAQQMWIELGDALDRNHLKSARRESRTVKVFYNLEVDGHQPGISTHSFVVNGMIASGLGDNPVLNEMFPRQTVWKHQSKVGDGDPSNANIN